MDHARRSTVAKLADLGLGGATDVQTFMSLPKAHYSQTHSTNWLERFTAEIQRRSDVVDVFQKDASRTVPAGALLGEPNDEGLHNITLCLLRRCGLRVTIDRSAFRRGQLRTSPARLGLTTGTPLGGTRPWRATGIRGTCAPMRDRQMLCSTCGSAASSEATFCWKCGAPLQHVADSGTKSNNASDSKRGRGFDGLADLVNAEGDITDAARQAPKWSTPPMRRVEPASSSTPTANRESPSAPRPTKLSNGATGGSPIGNLSCRLLEAATPAIQADVLIEEIGIELAGQEFGLFLDRGTAVPCSASKTFTTADDNQTSLDIHFQRRGSPAQLVTSLGRIRIESIAAGPRGQANIQVTVEVFDGDIWVHARDLTGQSNLTLARLVAEGALCARAFLPVASNCLHEVLADGRVRKIEDMQLPISADEVRKAETFSSNGWLAVPCEEGRYIIAVQLVDECRIAVKKLRAPNGARITCCVVHGTWLFVATERDSSPMGVHLADLRSERAGWDQLPIPSDLVADRFAIDDLVVVGAELVALDNIVTIKQIFRFDISRLPNVRFLACEDFFGGTYAQAHRLVAGSDWAVAFCSTSGRAGRGYHLVVWSLPGWAMLGTIRQREASMGSDDVRDGSRLGAPWQRIEALGEVLLVETETGLGVLHMGRLLSEWNRQEFLAGPGSDQKMTKLAAKHWAAMPLSVGPIAALHAANVAVVTGGTPRVASLQELARLAGAA